MKYWFMNKGSLIDHINAYYEEMNGSKSLCPIRISSFGDCPAKLFQLCSGADKEQLTARTHRIFEMGTQRGSALCMAIGGMIAGYLPEYELWIPINLPASVADKVVSLMSERFGAVDLPVKTDPDFPNALMVRGRADAVRLVNDGTASIVEFKTKNSFGFDKLPEEGPGLQYTLQVMGYIKALESEGYKVTDATFIFENKDNCDLYEHRLNIEAAQRMYDEWLPKFQRMLIELASGSDAASPIPTSVEPSYVAETVSKMLRDQARTAKLPWNCNYCSTGPAKCAQWCAAQSIDIEIVDKRRSGSDKPAYTVISTL
jgi:hypothetical protein